MNIYSLDIECKLAFEAACKVNEYLLAENKRLLAEAVALEPKQGPEFITHHACGCGSYSIMHELHSEEPKQEHRHDECSVCLYIREKSFEAGKASLKPFDVDALASIIDRSVENVWEPRETAKIIADNLATPERKPLTALDLLAGLGSFDSTITDLQSYDELADKLNKFFRLQPERKPWACTVDNAALIYHLYCGRLNAGEAYGRTTQVVLADTINEVLNLQPAPEEAGQARCPDCDHNSDAMHDDNCRRVHCSCKHPFHRERGTV